MQMFNEGSEDAGLHALAICGVQWFFPRQEKEVY
jgi:hypothetical protein